MDKIQEENFPMSAFVTEHENTPADELSKIRIDQERYTRTKSDALPNFEVLEKNDFEAVPPFEGSPIYQEDDGLGQDLDNIIKFESPFYRCSTTHSRFHYKQLFSRISNTIEESPFEGRKTMDNQDEIEDNTKNFLRRNSVCSYDSNISDFDRDYNGKMEVEVFDSIVMTILQVINCIIKYTLVQIAYCIKVLGLVGGSLTIGIIALMSLYSLRLLMQVKKITKENSYLAFTERMFGKPGKCFLLVLNFLSAYGSCLSFIIIFLKIFPNIVSFSLPSTIELKKPYLCFVLAVILMFYCYRQDVTGIKKAAYWGFIGIIFFFIITIADFLTRAYTGDGLDEEIPFSFIGGDEEKNWKERAKEVICAISCIILSFSYHVFAFGFYDALGAEKTKPFYVTATVSVFISTMIYMVCGIIGYLIYYKTLNDSILDSIGSTTLSSLLCVANMVSVIMTFPVTFAALKQYYCLTIEVFLTFLIDFFRWVFCCGQINNIGNASTLRPTTKKKRSFFKDKEIINFSKPVEFIFVIILFFSIFYLALICPSLKVICSFLGGVLANCFSFILPALFYIKFNNERRICSLKNFIPICFVLLGLFGVVCCIISTIASM